MDIEKVDNALRVDYVKELHIVEDKKYLRTDRELAKEMREFIDSDKLIYYSANESLATQLFRDYLMDIEGRGKIVWANGTVSRMDDFSNVVNVEDGDYIYALSLRDLLNKQIKKRMEIRNTREKLPSEPLKEIEGTKQTNNNPNTINL